LTKGIEERDRARELYEAEDPTVYLLEEIDRWILNIEKENAEFGVEEYEAKKAVLLEERRRIIRNA